jgi:hypothetical protein
MERKNHKCGIISIGASEDREQTGAPGDKIDDKQESQTNTHIHIHKHRYTYTKTYQWLHRSISDGKGQSLPQLLEKTERLLTFDKTCTC